MKRNGLIIFLIGFVCFSIGIIIGKISDRTKLTRELSLAGGTLQALSRVLESEKSKSGKYPDNLKLLDGSSFVTGDYSSEVATRVIYLRTEKGYFMIVGTPFHTFTDQTGHIQTK